MCSKNPLEALKWLIGSWKSLKVVVNYPTMKAPECFMDEIKFLPELSTQLTYTEESFYLDGKPKHWERGFLKVTDKGVVSLITAQNLGILTIEEGPLNKNCLVLQSKEVLIADWGKQTCGLTRCYKLNEQGQLEYLMKLQTDKVPMTDHIFALYEREKGKNPC